MPTLSDFVRLLDRIDMTIDVPAVGARDLIGPGGGEASVDVAERVAAARDIQRQRFAELGHADIGANGEAPAPLIEACTDTDDSARTLLGEAADRLSLSARGYFRTLRIARTLADLEACGPVRRAHVAEALSYRHSEPQRRAA